MELKNVQVTLLSATFLRSTLSIANKEETEGMRLSPGFSKTVFSHLTSDNSILNNCEGSVVFVLKLSVQGT